jgi:hypothetical protein
MRKAALFALIGVLGMTILLRADTRGSVHGKLLDPTDAVIPSATVQLISVLDGQERVTATDSEGHFNFLFLDAGPYRLTAAVAGFRTVEEQVTIVSGRLLEVNLKLKDLSGFTGEVAVADTTDAIENLTNNVYPINLGSDFNGSHVSQPRMAVIRLSYRF